MLGETACCTCIIVHSLVDFVAAYAPSLATLQALMIIVH